MAIYEFKCNDCGEVFSEMRKMGDFNPGNCTACGSKNTVKKMSSFATVGSSSTSSSAAPSCYNPHSCGGG
jgi:putative FmdB family regulatory protein